MDSLIVVAQAFLKDLVGDLILSPDRFPVPFQDRGDAIGVSGVRASLVLTE